MASRRLIASHPRQSAARRLRRGRIVIEDQKLLEKEAQKAGLGDIKVKRLLLDGGNVIKDAMMAGTLSFAGTGGPGFITPWSKARGIPNVEVVGIAEEVRQRQSQDGGGDAGSARRRQ